MSEASSGPTPVGAGLDVKSSGGGTGRSKYQSGAMGGGVSVSRLTRRTWHMVAVAGASAAGMILAACGGDAPAAAPTAAAKAEPTKAPAAPAPTAAQAAATAAPAPTVAPAAAKAPVEITYQTFFPQQRLDLLAGSFKIFAEKNPSIKANVVFDADHRAKLATQMAADSAPDTFIHDVWSAAKYYEAGGILDLTSRFAVDKIDLARDYSLIGIEQWCGKSYAVPFYVTSMLLAYNKDLLKKFGAPDPWEKWNGQWTWDDFLSVAKQVTKAPGADSPTGSWGLVMDGNGIDNIDHSGDNICTIGTTTSRGDPPTAADSCVSALFSWINLAMAVLKRRASMSARIPSIMRCINLRNSSLAGVSITSELPLSSSTRLRHTRCKKRCMPMTSRVFQGRLASSGPELIS